MSDTVIKTEGLGKKYIIRHEAEERYTALRDVVREKASGLFSAKKRPAKEEFWALKDISFEVKRGEAVGIIGRNGAGKSTLLKLLSRITEPTEGRIEIEGRTASLLEVGTGFHPELTGRENIFLNGAILGMSRSEIKKKFEAIVDFSGVEKFLDTPVKKFSSGMYLRLAFSIAAHLEPEILVVDEVLAVGDAEFQRKCLGKMDEVSRKEGRTVLFVSHNMPAIQRLCTKLFYLEDGKLKFEGEVDKGINSYINRTSTVDGRRPIPFGKGGASDRQIQISGFDVRLTGDNRKIQISITIETSEPIDNAEIAVGINDALGGRIITLHSRFMDQQFNLQKGSNEFVCTIDNVLLKPGLYSMNIFLGNRYETIGYLDEPLGFELQQSTVYPAGIIPDNSQGYLMADHTWILKTATHAGN